MNYLYISRRFNHSGYIILDSLIKSDLRPDAILLKNEFSYLDMPVLRYFAIILYRLKCVYYRCEPLKNNNSEEILAKKNNIKVITTKSIKSDSFYKKLKNLNPDLIVLGGGWPELIPERVYNYPKLGCVNTHPSLLPEFRGTSITRWQVLNGVYFSGSTIHFVDDKFDTGGVLVQKKIEVSKNWQPQKLFYKLGLVGAEIMVDLLTRFEKDNKRLETFEVNHNVKYYKYFSKWKWNSDILTINWNKSIREIHFFILSNIQESYQYLGPNAKVDGKKIFIRITDIFSKQDIDLNLEKNENFLTKKYYVYRIDKGNVIIGKLGDTDLLVIKQIQRFTKMFRFKRANKPTKIFNFKVGQKINLDEKYN